MPLIELPPPNRDARDFEESGGGQPAADRLCKAAIYRFNRRPKREALNVEASSRAARLLFAPARWLVIGPPDVRRSPTAAAEAARKKAFA